MTALICSDCERPAVRSCVCAFPLPRLCGEHRLDHATDSHFLLPLNALRHVQNIETQGTLNGRASKLRRLHSFVNLYSDPKQQLTIDIRELLMQFYKDVEDFKAEVKGLKAESVRGEEAKDERTVEGTVDILSALVWGETCPESELGTWMRIGYGLSLKARFQYEESCRVLEDRWKFVQSNKQVEVLVLSLVLSEVMGLHIGRFEEALAILEKSLQVADELYPKSDISLQLTNMKSAILVNLTISEECLDFCNKAVLDFHGAPTSEASFGTAIYLNIMAHIIIERIPEPEEEAIRKKWMLKTEDSSNSFIKHIRLHLSALQEMMIDDFKAAEGLLKAAKELTKRDFPTSIYAVFYLYTNFLIKPKMFKYQDEADFNDDEFLRVHFPASVLRAAILEPTARSYHRMKDKDKELEVRLLMHQILQRSPSSDLFINNVKKIAKIYSNNDQAALNIRETAYRILFERSFASPAFSYFLDSLSDCYRTLKLPEKEFEMYVEIIRKLQATDPTHKLLAEVLTTLARWEEDTQRERARQICVELYQFLRENCPGCENYCSALKAMAKAMIHKNLQQQEKVEDIFEESVQIAKTLYKFRDYVYYIDTLEEELQLNKFPKEKKVAILDEVYAFLISNVDPDCLNTASIISKLFSDQPEKLLTILLAVYHILVASPTSPTLVEYLLALIDCYNKTNQLEKVIESRLKVHQLLLNRDPCDNFFDNVDNLVIFYLDQNQIDKAVQFLMEACRHPSQRFGGHYKMIDHLTYHYSSKNRLDILLECYTVAYRTFQPASNPQYNSIVKPLCSLHYEVGNHDTAFQIAQECINSLNVLTEEGRENLKLLRLLLCRSRQFEQIIDIYTNLIPIYFENGCYSDVLSAFDSLVNTMWRSKATSELIEKLLGIAICLNSKGERGLFKRALNYLRDFFGTEGLENEEGVRNRKKFLQHSWPLCSSFFSTSSTLRQLGGYYWKAGEKEKTEACYFRAARDELSPFARNQLSTNKDYRSLYSGGQPSDN